MGRNWQAKEKLLASLESIGAPVQWIDRDDFRIFRHQWISKFMSAPLAYESKINSKYLDWHLFGHGKLPFVEGDQARESFDRKKKETQLAWACEADVGGCLFDWPASATPSAVVESWQELHWTLQDVMVVSPSFEWVFAVTHEREGMGLGPYFAVRPIR